MLAIYPLHYDNFVVIGNFNVEVQNSEMTKVLWYIWTKKSDNRANSQKPSFIDLILKNTSRNLQNPVKHLTCSVLWKRLTALKYLAEFWIRRKIESIPNNKTNVSEYWENPSQSISVNLMKRKLLIKNSFSLVNTSVAIENMW